MHKLYRGTAPTCLSSYRHGIQNWNDVSDTDKGLIWNNLDTMQGNRCAYCEADLSNGNKHIEHFVQRSRNQSLTFDWSNLFGSCNREDSCGKHKDKCGLYNPAHLIKPDIDDPEDFFVFVQDGTISIRKDLSLDNKHRASETLRIFNLDATSGPLRRMRQQAAAGYIQTAEEIYALAAEWPEEEWLPLLEEEINNTANLAFATAIKHTLTRQS